MAHPISAPFKPRHWLSIKSHERTRRTPHSTKPSSTSKSSGSHRPQPATPGEDPGLSFIFIVNELTVNEEPRSGGLLPQDLEGRWVPPLFAQGFYRQEPGRVYRWNNGQISHVQDYVWHHMHIDANEYSEAANGIVATANRIPLTRFRTATVFYANPFMKFRTAPGDATARNIYDAGEIWHHLRFHHVGPYRDITYVDHAGSEDYIAGRSNTCPWHKQLIPQAYECTDEPSFPSGGLAGLLPILISLVAFSCSKDRFDGVLLNDRSWTSRNWIRHDRSTGSE